LITDAHVGSQSADTIKLNFIRQPRRSTMPRHVAAARCPETAANIGHRYPITSSAAEQRRFGKFEPGR
jgi:hypothetical protein